MCSICIWSYFISKSSSLLRQLGILTKHFIIFKELQKTPQVFNGPFIVLMIQPLGIFLQEWTLLMLIAFIKIISKGKQKIHNQIHAYFNIHGILLLSFLRYIEIKWKEDFLITPLKWYIMVCKEEFLFAIGRLSAQLKYIIIGSIAGKTITMYNLVELLLQK